MGVEPKIWESPPNHPFVHRVFHYKPSILGPPIFGNTQIGIFSRGPLFSGAFAVSFRECSSFCCFFSPTLVIRCDQDDSGKRTPRMALHSGQLT